MSFLYATNQREQKIKYGGVISFGSVVRRAGDACGLDVGYIVLSSDGYYNLTASFCFRSDEDVEAEVILYSGGFAIPGATAKFYARAGEPISVSIPSAIERVNDGKPRAITALLLGEKLTVESATITAEKLR